MPLVTWKRLAYTLDSSKKGPNDPLQTEQTAARVLKSNFSWTGDRYH